MHIFLDEYINSFNDTVGFVPRCSYVFVKGQHKGLVCNNRLGYTHGIEHKAVKNWRCFKCEMKVGHTNYFDNIINPYTTNLIRNPAGNSNISNLNSTNQNSNLVINNFNNQNSRISNNNNQHNMNMLRIFELIQFVISVTDTQDSPSDQIRTTEHLNQTQPLLQTQTDLPKIINQNGNEEPPPKIYEEDEQCEKPCVICLSKAPRFAVIPCGHLIFCDDCGKETNLTKIKNECSICRIAITSLIRIYN